MNHHECTQPPPLLDVQDLHVSYAGRRGATRILNAIDLSVFSGEKVGVVGESGCGKSTLALAIMRYLGRSGRIDRGSIQLGSQDITRATPAEMRAVWGSKLAMVYQEPTAALNPSMRVGRQLAEVLTNRGTRSDHAIEASHRMIGRVGLADGERIMRSFPHQLSGGQQQRIVIAMALIAEPELLIMDEPTTALDVTVEASIIRLTRELVSGQDTALLFISHNLALVQHLCDRVVVLYAGQIVESGMASDVFAAPRHPYTRALIDTLPAFSGAQARVEGLRPIPGNLPSPDQLPRGCPFGPRCQWFSTPECAPQSPRLVAVNGATDRQVRCARSEAVDTVSAGSEAAAPLDAKATNRFPRAPIVEIENLTKEYARPATTWRGILSRSQEKVRANDGIDLAARPMQTIGLVGESGCGKSTLARIMLGLESASTGTIRVLGKELQDTPVERRDHATLSAIQMVFQNPVETLNPSSPVGTQLGRALKHAKPAPSLQGSALRRAVGNLLRSVQLSDDYADALPDQLSGGQKQRVAIARAFAGQPEVVVADEPLSALDVSVQAAIATLMHDLCTNHGATLLLISHDLAIVRLLADQIFVMYAGRIIEHGPTASVFAPPYHPYTEALISAIPIADGAVCKRFVPLHDAEQNSARTEVRGCPFFSRCKYRKPTVCDRETPTRHTFPSGHTLHCHQSREDLLAMKPVLTLRSDHGTRTTAAERERVEAPS